ncbi:MAG: EamA family transporter [Salaquimonas sp.]|jgi:drug/metabolite transporter (DMT)-like permease|nr:EamA family transporter [Salaquimonas sp.]
MRIDLALLIIVPVMIASGQFLFKMASKSLTGQIGRDLFSLAFNPYFIGAIALYGLASFLWVIAVSKTDISRAYPFMASGFVIVPIIGYFLLNETLNPTFFLGTALIVGGILVISLS